MPVWLISFLLQTEPYAQTIRGRPIGPKELTLIQGWLRTNPTWSRTRLSSQLCLQWNWRNAAGRLKDMACRSLLLKLEAQGHIVLPPRQAASADLNCQRNQRLRELAHDQSPIHCDLSALRPLRIEPLAQDNSALALFRFLLARYHYLGLRNCVGENLKYLVRERTGRPLACVLFGSAAWHSQPRDLWIGWNAEQRRSHLQLLTNNARFLVLPWAKVPHLASHVLSQVAARLSSDWQAKYGHPIVLLETFVERDRFGGACYRAAGWRRVGLTSGRSRKGPDFPLQVPIKEIYLQPLVADWGRRLSA